jgi:hypothetical protein
MDRKMHMERLSKLLKRESALTNILVYIISKWVFYKDKDRVRISNLMLKYRPKGP